MFLVNPKKVATFFGFTDTLEMMKRVLAATILEERKAYQKMIFIAGPRQVGKTTVLNQVREHFPGRLLNWDNPDDRAVLARDPKKLFESCADIYFDEIHKYPRWKRLAILSLTGMGVGPHVKGA